MKREKTVLDKFKTLLLKQVSLDKLILFGSRARGDAGRYSDIDKFYTLRSLPQFLISVILACPESFLRSRTSRKDSRQAGMTLKTNVQFQTPCGLCRRVLHVVVVLKDDADEQDFDYVSDCAWEAGFEYGIVIVPVVFTKNEWGNGPERYSLLAQAVEKEGVPI